MEYLFPKFLDDAQQYRAAQAFWAALCKEVLAKHHQAEMWKPWFTEVKLDGGSILRDGNPIYSLVNPKELKGVTVIQQDPKINTKWEMTAFVNTFGDEHYEPDPINNLVFTCNLTRESASTFEKLFEVWIQPECKVQCIEEVIKDFGIG
jgi:hypothetical protein